MSAVPKRIVFCGHHSAGKDEAAKFLCAHYAGLDYARSLSHYVAELLADRLGVPVAELRGPDRHRYAMQFYEFANEVRAECPGHFLKLAFARGNVTTGARARAELEWGRSTRTVDLFIWVHRYVPLDPTMTEYQARDCDLMIDNTGTLEQLHDRLRAFAEFSGYARLDNPRPVD